MPLLGLRVGLEEDHEALPDRAQALGVVARPLLEDREHRPLLVVLRLDDLADVHGDALRPRVGARANAS